MGLHADAWIARTRRATSSDRPRRIGRIMVHGLVIDDETRCEHYHGPLDVIAVQFACCGEWYPCYLCHEEVAAHEARRWGVGEREKPAILCGACGRLLSIAGYLEASACPTCAASFNPGCRLHHRLYFD